MRWRIADATIALVGVGLAVLLRLSLLDFKSIDYFNYTKVWYGVLKTTGFSAFGGDFSNYNLPYLYVLYLVARFLPDVPAHIATKIPSLAADFVAAWLVFRIVRLKYADSIFPSFAALAILFAPTLVLNSAFWGQADAIYASAILASVYFLMRRQPNRALLLFGLALAFKAQALLLLPLIVGLVLRRDISWRHLAWVPAVLFLALLPAMLAGRPFGDLLLIYPAQAGQYEQLSLHAPSAWAWIPDTGRFYPYFYPAGLILSAAAGLAFALALYWAPAKLTPSLILELAVLSVTIMPFLLPKMHERYFYLADVLCIVLAFHVPKYYWAPLLMISISFFSYQPTLFGAEPVPMGLLALGVCILIIGLSRHVLLLMSATSTDDGGVVAVQ
jgi:Gpi18-like mannosyltransferase